MAYCRCLTDSLLCSFGILFSVIFALISDTFSQKLFLQRKSRGCQTVAQGDAERCMLESSLEFAKGALQQISSDCNATLVQFTHDIEFDRIQASFGLVSFARLLSHTYISGSDLQSANLSHGEGKRAAAHGRCCRTAIICARARI